MPPKKYNSLTVSDEVMEQFGAVMIEYDYDSLSDSVLTASALALKQDEAELARILADPSVFS
jgi:lipoprotein NlpI